MTAESALLTCAEADELAGLYVLNALEGADEARVRIHLETCVHPHPSFAEMGGAVNALPETVTSIEPPAGLRDRVLAAVAATAQDGAAAGVVAPSRIAAPLPPSARNSPALWADDPRSGRIPAAEPISLAAERERRTARFGRPWQMALSAAAVLLIVVLGATTMVFQRQASDADQRAHQLSAAIAASLDANSSVAGLHGTAAAPTAAGFAAFPKDGTGFVVIHGLPQPPSGKTYEAWFIAGSTPYPSVLVTPGSDGLLVISGLTAMPGADAMALTVEPAGGVQAPTGDVVVSGKMQQGPVASAIVSMVSATLH